ncbi:hypothetical protein JHL17_25155 [Azospirillum sp. YIM B02556]|uniref:Uncharacterized protein n=1 Tax=Azospirillum endophyticum TaxID=2800326 RepID=A0ABS1FB94_9PROT|nr:hypothetical protein [Azospirillum endophyticum]MBK1840697.1 hypothetical protein [Azospirillum endophyticum]
MQGPGFWCDERMPASGTYLAYAGANQKPLSKSAILSPFCAACSATEAGTIIPAYISNVDALSRKVKGMRKNPFGNLEGYAFAEHVRLEA